MVIIRFIALSIFIVLNSNAYSAPVRFDFSGHVDSTGKLLQNINAGDIWSASVFTDSFGDDIFNHPVSSSFFAPFYTQLTVSGITIDFPVSGNQPGSSLNMQDRAGSGNDELEILQGITVERFLDGEQVQGLDFRLFGGTLPTVSDRSFLDVLDYDWNPTSNNQMVLRLGGSQLIGSIDSFSVSFVPEPPVFALAAVGLAYLSFNRRRFRITKLRRL